jgi:hypothetical protein
MAVPPDGAARQRVTHVALLARPAGQRVRPMVERHQEELVGGIEQLEQELVDRRARIVHPLAEHAVADVEQHAEPDRHALVGELRHRLQDAVLVDLKRLAPESGDRVSFLVDDRRRDAGDLDAGLKQAAVGDGRLLRDETGRGERRDQEGESGRTETRAHSPC